MEKTLAEPLQRALLAQVIEQMPAGVIIAAPNGRLLLGNRQAERIWRHDLHASESVHGYETWKGFDAHGAALEASRWPLARSLQTGEVVDGEEIAFERGDGTRGVMRVSSAPIRDGRGNIAAGVVTFFDITEQRREQNALRFLAEASAAIGATLATDDTLREVVRLAIPSFADVAIVYLTGADRLSRLEVAAADDEKRRVLKAAFGESPHWTSPAVRKALESGEPVLLADLRSDYQRVVGAAPNLSIIDAISAQSMIIVSMRSGGEPLGALTFVSTETEHRYDPRDLFIAEEIARRCAAAIDRNALFEAERAQRMRAESGADRLQHLQKLSSALSAALTLDDVAAAVTAEAREIAGASIVVVARVRDGELDIIGASGMPERVLDQYRTIPLDSSLPLAEAIRTGSPVWLGTLDEAVARSSLFRDARRDSSSRAWATLPLMTDGAATGVIGLSFATERTFTDEDRNFLMSMASQCALAFERARLYDSERRARTEAEQASRAKDDFLAILSHELRTPMTTVIGWADFLKMTHREDAELAAPIESLRTSARAQARLVDDLLDVSRIVTGKLRIVPRSTDLAAVIGAAVDEVRVSASAKNIDLRCDGQPQSLPIHGDPDRLRQVFTNLLTNAIKFTPPDGRVSIRAKRRESVYEIVVEDTGEGISPEFLPHVFDRFRQASIGDSRRHSGLGLGLSIVEHLVHLHGGEVLAQSDGIGKGARFTVTLPAPVVANE